LRNTPKKGGRHPQNGAEISTSWKGGGMKKQMILALAIFGHLFLFLFVDSLFEAPTKWKMWAFYGSSLLSVAVWAAYVIFEDDNNPKGGAA
jgi:hypothetical protein